jgi:hypothetical protein
LRDQRNLVAPKKTPFLVTGCAIIGRHGHGEWELSQPLRDSAAYIPKHRFKLDR